MKQLFIGATVILFSATVAVAQTSKPKTKPAVKTTTAASAVTMKNLSDSFSYAAGLNIATNMKEQGISNINAALVGKAIDDVYKGKAQAMTAEKANSCLQAQMGIYGQQKQAEAAKKSAAEAAKGKAFLEANKTHAGVITLPNGLQYEIIKAGDPAGVKPTAQDTVVVTYLGKLIDGTEFDGSEKHGGPVTFPLGQVIKGWTDIIQLMTKGAHWKVYIPSELGYGDTGNGGAIAPGATLIFDITLEDIKPMAVK